MKASLFENITREEKELLLVLKEAKSRQPGWMLSMWGNDPVRGVSICISSISRLGFENDRVKCLTAIEGLKRRGLLMGGEIHWRIPFSVFQPRRKQIPRQIRLMVLSIGQCKHCGGFENLTVDHITPVAREGTNDITNLQPLCRRCNSSKRDRFIG